MQKLEVLPTILYEFEAPIEVLEEAKNFINNIDWTEVQNRNDVDYFGKTSVDNLQINPDLKNYTEWSTEKINEIKNENNLACDKLIPVNTWANCSFYGQWHHKHFHPLSYLSSIFYITGNSGDTWFSRVCDYHNAIISIKPPEDAQIIYKHKPREGTLIVFPSTLEHSVSENLSLIPRTTFSSNYLPTGLVGVDCQGFNCDIVYRA